MKQRFRSGGLAAWSIKHPIGISMLALAAIILGVFALQRLGLDLLPHIIYPEVRVRVLDPGVPASVMEDRITRQLEEQLAITENAIQVQSQTTEGRSSVDLSFPYGTDIDIALRDASTRLDRAKRFLPESIEPPVIYKRDPSQIAVMELVASSNQRDSIELRSWADYTFSKWFLNLPGVAAVEVGGGLEREIQVIANQERIAGLGLNLIDLANIIRRGNEDAPGGQLLTSQREISTRTEGRLSTIDELLELPLTHENISSVDHVNQLHDVADVFDSHVDERLRIRLNKSPGIKLSIQKQPQANTVAVVESVRKQLDWLRQQALIPEDISVTTVGDQSIFIKHSLNNASMAAISGAILAMIVIYVFLGDLKRTLIIGTAIPIGILVTFAIMEISGLTLNIMTLGGMALGMGLLIDSTIVMLENITRHQHDAGTSDDNAVAAAAEVNSPIVASTGTNLAAVLPFLFIGGLTGLLFKELIITITSAMLAALVVALTLVPALGSKIKTKPVENSNNNNAFKPFKEKYTHWLSNRIQHPWHIIFIFVIALALAIFTFMFLRPTFMPSMDEGDVLVSITGDPGIHLDEMDAAVNQVEDLLLSQPEVKTLFTITGGFVFGRSEFEVTNRSSVRVQLVPMTQRKLSSEQWVKEMEKAIQSLQLTGYTTRLRVRGITGVRVSSGDDDISMRIQGDDLPTLVALGTKAAELMKPVKGIRNIEHTYEENREELKIKVDRQRAADLGIRVDELGEVLRIALNGSVISDFIDGDRQFDIRLRLPRSDTATPEALNNLLVGFHQNQPVRLHEVGSAELGPASSRIKRDQQQRIVEISASLEADSNLNEIMESINEALSSLELPDGYYLYDGGANQALRAGQQTGVQLLFLAIFLVFVVMAVQYESLINPLVIIFSIPFAVIGVTLGLVLAGMPISMPVWLGLIMLAGIVVNNAIMLVEQIEIERETTPDMHEAISHAASLRLRPILMTTLTTVFGMMPLALGLGEGSEMLQPLAYVIVCGLSFSMLVSLVLIPAVYRVLHAINPFFV